jgi:hypothetical protein
MGSKVQEPEVVTRFVLLLCVLKIHLLSKYVIVCQPSIVINDHTFNTVSSQIIPLIWCDVISVHFAEGIYNMGTQVWINVCWFKCIYITMLVDPTVILLVYIFCIWFAVVFVFWPSLSSTRQSQSCHSTLMNLLWTLTSVLTGKQNWKQLTCTRSFFMRWNK